MDWLFTRTSSLPCGWGGGIETWKLGKKVDFLHSFIFQDRFCCCILVPHLWTFLYRVSQKHGNSGTNWLTSLLWVSIVIPNFKSHNIFMSAIYFMERVKDCKDVSIMSPQDDLWRRTSLLCLPYCNFLALLSTTVCSQNINKMWT